MSSLSDFLGGGGGGGLGINAKSRTYKLTRSGTFVFPFSGTVDIYAIGGGGVGGIGILEGVNSNNMFYAGTGGGAGGTAVKRDFAVSAGDKIIISCGARAEFRGANSAVNNPVINNAGATTVNSNDLTISLTANGGGNGNTAVSNTASTVASLSGGAGGTGSGGDDNYTGGRGGNYTFTATPNVGNGYNAIAASVATGGGGVGINGTGGHGGDAIIELNTGAGGTTDHQLNLTTGGGAANTDACDVIANEGAVNRFNKNIIYTKAYGGAGAIQGFEVSVTAVTAFANSFDLGDFGYNLSSITTSEELSMPRKRGGEFMYTNGNPSNNLSGGIVSGGGSFQNAAFSSNATFTGLVSGGLGGLGGRVHTTNASLTQIPSTGYDAMGGGGAGHGFRAATGYEPSVSNVNGPSGGAGACLIEYKTITA